MNPLMIDDELPPGTARAPRHAQGLLPRLLTRLLFRPATITDKRTLARGLHLITLEGPALRGLRWSPGDKLQIRLGPGLQTRTYTPIDWDARSGRTRLLAHALAWGPGSEWVQRVQPGQTVEVFGPRRSLDLVPLDESKGLLVGDETAIGLAAAWRPAHALFEVGDRAAVQAALDALQLQATAIAQQPDGLHLEVLVNAMLGLARPDTHFVLAGRARTVQHLLRALRGHGVASHRILTKAYWAEGKTGLD